MLGLLFAISTSCAVAQTVTDIKAPAQSAYGEDSSGTVLRSGYGLCWRGGNWTPTDALAGCDGKLAPPIANRIAPEIVSPPEETNRIAAIKPCDFAITLESDETFAFNKTVLSDAAKRRIDRDVLTRLATCSTIETVTITGYADRIGNQQSNQKLSLKRASAVAAYLKENGVSTRIEAIGAGSTQAVKKCDAVMGRAQLIVCLAPNRRVLLETHLKQK